MSTLVLSACVTTGDPHQGGLFGFSPGKERERRQGLRQDNGAAQQELQGEQQTQKALQGQQTTLASDRDRLQTEVDQLLTENTRLTDTLASLIQRTQLQQAEFERLKQSLARNESLRRQAGSATGSRALDEQNEELHQDILMLLHR